jgi:hypothetical protein
MQYKKRIEQITHAPVHLVQNGSSLYSVSVGPIVGVKNLHEISDKILPPSQKRTEIKIEKKTYKPAISNPVISHKISEPVMSKKISPNFDMKMGEAPVKTTQWGFGGQALYLASTSTSGQYTYVAQNSQGQFLTTPNPWDWGFQLEASYLNLSSKFDVNLNWYHLRASGTKHFSGPYTFFFGTTPDATEGSVSVHPQWDAVNLEFGHNVQFDDRKSIRIHGGVQYARVANSALVTLADGVVLSTQSTSSSTYNGFGPRLGADLNYAWENGVGVYAKGAGAILIGQSTMNDTSTYSGLYNNSNVSSTSATAMVPELEAKLGLKYDHVLARGNLQANLGWMWVNYFNAQSTLLTTAVDVVNNSAGFQGPYLGLKWQQ